MGHVKLGTPEPWCDSVRVSRPHLPIIAGPALLDTTYLDLAVLLGLLGITRHLSSPKLRSKGLY